MAQLLCCVLPTSEGLVMKITVGTVVMDAAEAIRKGSVGMRQCYEQLFQFDRTGQHVVECCLIGACKIAANGINECTLANFVVATGETYACPVCDDFKRTPYHLLAHLNDIHMLGFEEAAKVLEGI